MRVRIARSIKQPLLNSIYISNFSEETLDLLNKSKPFTAYHKHLQEYEITPEVLRKIKEPVTEIKHEEVKYTCFKRTHSEKYGYQEDAVEFARDRDSIFLNFPQGMGKSLTTMKIIKDRGLKRVLIVCGQGNLQEEWIKDAIKHGYKDMLKMAIVGNDTGAGNPAKVKWLLEAKTNDGVDLINLEALRNESIVQALNARMYECIVVDEVQSAKGWKSEQAQGMHELVKHEGQVRIALSGTPILNNPLEFFSMLKYFGQLVNTARTTFEGYYGVWEIDEWGYRYCSSYKNFEDLNELISPIVCFVSKSELNLPVKRRKLVRLDWHNDEFEELKRIYRLSSSRLRKAGYESKPEVKAKMDYLTATAQPKIDFVLEHSATTRLLVFSQHTKVLERYRDALVNKGRKVLYYHGGLGMKERLEVLEQWRTGVYDVLLLSTMAARYGLNLTEANEVVFVDIPSSLAVMEQAEDRTHRIGQDKPVVSYLLSASEIDEHMLESIERKQEEIDKLTALRDETLKKANRDYVQ